MWGLQFSPGSFWRIAGGVVANDPSAAGTLTLDLAVSSDLGTSGTDNITNDDTPRIDIDNTVAWAENDEINIYDNAVLLTNHVVTAGEVGSGTIALDLSALAEGAHPLTAEHVRGASTGPLSSTLTVTIDTTAPTITSTNTASVAENAALSKALTANETVTWALTGGVDAAHFEISGSTLRWLSNGTKDYETPGDTGTNNTYVVDIAATDTAGNQAFQSITVTVTDVAEGVDAWLLEDSSGQWILEDSSGNWILEA
jgi:hypothetical protein